MIHPRTSPLSPLPLAAALAITLVACGDAGSDSADAAPEVSDAGDVVEVNAPDVVDTSVEDGADIVDPDAPYWHVELQDLSAALLSVSGDAPDDIWLTGADKGDGPLVIRGQGGVWARVDLRAADADGGHLWWSVAPDDTGRVLVGEGGRVFRWDAQSGEVTRVPTDTDATLYGVWGASRDELWAVGGYVHPRSGPPTIVRVRDGEGEAVTDLPAELGAETTLFKVWGSAADDVWVVGEAGTVLHWDGGGWTLDTLPGAPRLVTIHGASASDMVAVGGSSQALIFERAGGVWHDVSPGPYSLLNGVYVAPDGAALAVGVLGQTFFRRSDGVWTSDVDLPLNRDWHAAWIDARGDAWIAGGHLLSASTFDAGTVLRFGPDRDDLPSGDVIPLDSVVAEPEPDVVEPEPDVVEPEPDVVEPEPDVVEPEPDVVEPEPDVVEPEPDVVEPDVDVIDDVEVIADTTVIEDTEMAEDTEDVEVIADTGASDGDALDTSVEDASDDVAADTVVPDPGIALGRLVGATDFTAFEAGELAEIVQGPQGGIHIEIAVRFPWPGVTAPSADIAQCDTAAAVDQAVTSCGQCPCTAVTGIDAHSFVDGVDVGAYVTTGYPVSLLAAGVYQTYVVPVIFYTVDAAPFVGKTVEIRVAITLPDGEQRETAITLTMQDEF